MFSISKFLHLNDSQYKINNDTIIYTSNTPTNNLLNKYDTIIFNKHNSKFNKPIDNLPISIKILKISEFHLLSIFNFFDNFNQKIDNLPNSLYYIDIDFSKFNQKIDNLPSFLKILKLSEYFNQTVDKLPYYLYALEFGHDFNQSIDKLPQSLHKLSIGLKFNKGLDFLPESLKILDLVDNKKINKINDLPSNIEQIIINRNQKYKLNTIYHHKIKLW